MFISACFLLHWICKIQIMSLHVSWLYTDLAMMDSDPDKINGLLELKAGWQDNLCSPARRNIYTYNFLPSFSKQTYCIPTLHPVAKCHMSFPTAYQQMLTIAWFHQEDAAYFHQSTMNPGQQLKWDNAVSLCCNLPLQTKVCIHWASSYPHSLMF